jgi:hypothetical protein
VSDWAVVFLGVIAVATLTTAIGQIGMFVAANRLLRKIEGLVASVEQEVKPIFGHLNAIGRDASRAASLATSQVERLDRLLATLTERLNELLHTLQESVARPARDSAAIVAGFKAAMRVVQELRTNRARARAEDEEAMFI